MPIAGAEFLQKISSSGCASCLLYVRKVGIVSCDYLAMSIHMFSLQTHELSLLLCCALDYLAMVI